MNMHSPKEGERGFMKALVVGTVAFCFIFIFLFKFAQYFGTGASTSFSRGAGISGSWISQPNTNYLIDFGDSNNYGSYSSGGTVGRTVPNTDGKDLSPYAGRVTLSVSNARAIQTYEEYVTIHNRGEAVSITGWTLTNSKGTRPIETMNNSYVYPAAESATIGTGTEFLSPDGVFQTGPIILANGDTAIVTTGRPYTQYPFSIYTSFRENMCIGYLRNYTFNPPVNRSCPYIVNDPLIRTVTDLCYDYIRSLGRCALPEREDKKRYEEQITSQCRAFIEERVGYENCVARSANLPGFASNQWRVFLSKDREMWAQSRETITLYDNLGSVVDQVSY